jgi:hypothetical protein
MFAVPRNAKRQTACCFAEGTWWLSAVVIEGSIVERSRQRGPSVRGIQGSKTYPRSTVVAGLYIGCSCARANHKPPKGCFFLTDNIAISLDFASVGHIPKPRFTWSRRIAADRGVDPPSEVAAE